MNMDLNVALRTVVFSYLIAGAAGTSGLTSVVCNRLNGQNNWLQQMMHFYVVGYNMSSICLSFVC